VDEMVLNIMRTIRFLFSRAVIIISAGYLVAILRRINYTACYRVSAKYVDETKTFDKVENNQNFVCYSTFESNYNYSIAGKTEFAVELFSVYNDFLSTAEFNNVGWLS
jgi:hypothetical protein